MLDAFKIKPFDLDPVFAAWTPGPRFLGDPKKDPPVDDWLKEIKSGCTEHHVPQEYWHTCGQHFMGDQAKARLDELKKVMAQMHGGKYRWNWKKFKVAMRNMSWDIDTSETETVKVGPFWWIPKALKSEPKLVSEDTVLVEEPAEMEPAEITPTLSRSGTVMSTKTVGSKAGSERPAASRSSTLASLWPVRRNTKETKESTVVSTEQAVVPRPAPRQVKSEGSLLSSKELPPLPNSKDVTPGTVRAPAWLLNATQALDFLSGEHPKVMSALGAILIVAGTIPSLPVISAGAGGAVLASSTAHAVGAIAVGIGSWIKTQQESQAGKSQ